MRKHEALFTWDGRTWKFDNSIKMQKLMALWLLESPFSSYLQDDYFVVVRPNLLGVSKKRRPEKVAFVYVGESCDWRNDHIMVMVDAKGTHRPVASGAARFAPSWSPQYGITFTNRKLKELFTPQRLAAFMMYTE